MPSEPAQLGHRGRVLQPFPAQTSQHTDTNTTCSRGHKEVTAQFQVTKAVLKRSLGIARSPRKPLEAAGARVLRRILGVQITPAFSSWTSSFPLARAAGKYVWACLAECCHMLQKDFAITPPHSVEPGCAKVLGFGSVVAAQPLGCLQTGTVGWTGKVKGGWGMGNHLKFMLHTAENPSWKAAVWI